MNMSILRVGVGSTATREGMPTAMPAKRHGNALTWMPKVAVAGSRCKLPASRAGWLLTEADHELFMLAGRSPNLANASRRDRSASLANSATICAAGLMSCTRPTHCRAHPTVFGLRSTHVRNLTQCRADSVPTQRQHLVRTWDSRTPNNGTRVRAVAHRDSRAHIGRVCCARARVESTCRMPQHRPPDGRHCAPGSPSGRRFAPPRSGWRDCLDRGSQP